MHPLLQINNLHITFESENGSTTAVSDISLTVNRNEIVGIAGESGSGKSVTSLAILQLLSSKNVRYTDGEILYSRDGITQQNLIGASEELLRSIRGKEIGMIFQEPMTSLNPVFTCGDQVMEAIKLHHPVSNQEALERTIKLFDRVKLPDPEKIVSSFPHQLSGGQKQRVMIAMAMSGNPSLLICDEPTTALDVTVQKTVLHLIRDLQQETGMGVIFITHDLGVIAEIASKVVIMYKGRIAEEGKLEHVFTDPQDRYTRALLACRPALYPKGVRLPVVADLLEKDKAASQKSHPGELPHESGKVSASAENAARVLLSVSHLSVWYPSKRSFFGRSLSYTRAVDDVSFNVFEGETLGLVGESGCGKTTLGRTLLRLIRPTSGSIFYDGIDMSRMSSNQLNKFRKHLQIIFQDPYSSLNPSLTIGFAIGEPLVVHQPSLSPAERKEKVTELLEKVGMNSSHLNRYPHEFSGGQRQRIVIARALALEPSFIICDESVSALDVSVQAQVLNLLNDLKKEFRFTSIFISHDLSVIRYMCDRIMVMNKGKIVETGTPESIYNSPQSPFTRQLLESIPRSRFTVKEK